MAIPRAAYLVRTNQKCCGYEAQSDGYKSSSYSDLLTHVDLKILEYRRYPHALTLVYKCMYNMGPINIEMFIFRNNEYDLI